MPGGPPGPPALPVVDGRQQRVRDAVEPERPVPRGPGRAVAPGRRADAQVARPLEAQDDSHGQLCRVEEPHGREAGRDGVERRPGRVRRARFTGFRVWERVRGGEKRRAAAAGEETQDYRRECLLVNFSLRF